MDDVGRDAHWFREGEGVMPKETVQYPSMNNPASEVSVHWSKPDAGGHVQLRVEQHVWAAERCPNGCTEENLRSDSVAKMGCSSCPPQADPVPVGSIKISDDGHVARKTTRVYEGGGEDEWMLWRREGGIEPNVKDSQIATWPLIWVPEGGSVPGVIYTEVFERGNINRMIKVLRQARDDAYGRDE
jgi:hypothetical protein